MSNIKSKMPRMKVGAMQPTGNLKHNSLASGPDVSIKEPPEFTGITGVNMPIPEAKSLTIHFDAVKIQKLEPSKKSNFGGEKHDISAKDASDKVSVYDQKQLMERICMLEQETAQLITQLKEKDMAISNVTKLMQHKISECNQLVKKEHQNYERTEQKLKQAEILAAETLQILNESRKEFEEKSEHLTMLHEEKLAAMRRESTSEISCRDEKISKLKKQIAEILQRKSWYFFSCKFFLSLEGNESCWIVFSKLSAIIWHLEERQQQLHELKQEVMRLSEEANRLQRELKLQKSLKQECKRCKSLQLKRSSDK